MSRNATVTVDPRTVPQDRSRQHNTRNLLVLALAAALLLGIAGVVMTRDDVAISGVPAPVTQEQPVNTGDWKDSFIGGDGKDIMVERLNEQPAYTGDWKDSLVGR